MQPIITTVLDLDAALGGNAGLMLGGGLGLYLKQEHLRRTGARTLLPFDRLPQARTTQDIDLFLRAEVIANARDVAGLRAALDSLGFTVVQGAEWLKFRREVAGTEVLLDVMVGPLGEFADRVKFKDPRVRPKGLPGDQGVHAFATEEALGIERSPMTLTITEQRPGGSARSCAVRVPRAFTYALMKLGALRDRVHDQNKQEGRHHAMDLYRIVGMITQEEEAICAEMAKSYAGDPQIDEAMRTIDSLLEPASGLGRLRLIEYQRASQGAVPEVDPDLLVSELRRLLR